MFTIWGLFGYVITGGKGGGGGVELLTFDQVTVHHKPLIAVECHVLAKLIASTQNMCESYFFEVQSL